MLPAALSEMIELLGLERFRKENPLAEAAPQFRGGVVPLQTGVADAVIFHGQGEPMARVNPSCSRASRCCRAPEL